MVANIIKWSINNRLIILIMTAFLVVAGSYSLYHTPVDAIPDLSDVQVIIKTSYPGQAPQVVEDQVTYPLASAMLAVPGAVNVRAYSFFGDSYVYVIFKDGTDLYWARSRVLEYLSQVSSKLPVGVKPELGPDATGVGWVYEYALQDKTGQHDLAELTTLQNWILKFELQTLPGVAEVATIGGMVKQYQVIVQPNRLRAYGLSLTHLRKAIKRANSEVGGSVVEMAEGEYMVRANGYIQSLDDLRAVALGVNDNGTPITLGNVADIRFGPQMRRGVAELDGKGEVVGGVVVMRMGENALTTISAVKQRLQQVKTSLPKGVEIVETYNRASLIQRAINNLQGKLLEETLVVILVCFLFLFHFRSSLIIVISLPIGILAAFFVMYWQGVNANIMSLGGIAIAIGTMVDAAIVMIENVHKHLEGKALTDENRWQVITDATLEVGPALFFTLLIITLSFMPVFALQAQEGRLFAPLAYTKTYAMAAAAVLSITLVPVLMGYLIKGHIMAEEKNPLNRMLVSAYKPIINTVLYAPKTTVMLAIVIVLVSVFPFRQLGSEFMPTLDEGDWMYMPTMLPGVSIGKARQVLQQTDKLIATIPEVTQVFGKVGRADTATDPAPLTMIETVIRLKPKQQWRAGLTSEKLKQELNQRINFPGLTNAWIMPIKTRIDMLATGIKTPVGIKITGASLTEIQAIGHKIEVILKKLAGTASVYADRVVGGRYVHVDIDRRAAARFGLNTQDVQDVVKTAIGGMNVAQTIEGRERYPINLRYPQAGRDSVSSLQMLPIVTPVGAHIPLADVARVSVADGPSVIKSENAQLTGWVLVDIDGDDVGSYINKAQAVLAKELELKPGYNLIWSGQYEYMQRAKQRLLLVGPLTLAIIILLLFINFKSLSEVLIVLLTLPLALTGGIWLLYWLDYNLSVAIGVGFIALAGVAVEIGVVMLVYLNHAWRNYTEQTPDMLSDNELKKIVLSGSLARVRPIVMTVATVIAGLLPIMLGTGTGSEVMRRIAAPMVGGMVSAIALTLFVIPALFYLLKRRQITN